MCSFVFAGSETKIKNIIFLIPDGAGFALFDFANGVKEMGGFNAGLYPNSTPHTDGPMYMKDYLIGTVTTNSANNAVTDSAAGGTALATGHKTNNDYVAVDTNGAPMATILEAAQYLGKKTGLCTTYEWTNATPADFSSHSISRKNYSVLSEQIVNQGLDVVLGVGFGLAQFGSINNAIDLGYSVINNKTDLQNVKPGEKIWGNITNTGMPWDIYLNATQPTLAEMTSCAIKALSSGENGFFLMVEGSRIDGGGHDNNILETTSEYLSFDAACRVAIEYAKTRTDTVVIMAPDHDTGGLILPNSDDTDTIGGNVNYQDYAAAIAEVQAGINSTNGLTWSSVGHSSRHCGVWLYKPEGVAGIEGLADTPGDTPETRSLVVDNTDVANYLARLFNVDLDDITEELFVDVTDQGFYDEDSNEFTFYDADITVCPNQSTAVVDGKTVDLQGRVTVYSNGRFYVPRVLLDAKIDISNYLKIKDARFGDDTDGTVLIKGSISKKNAGQQVTVFVTMKNAGKLSRDNIAYIDNTVINDDGSYCMTFKTNINFDDYEIKARLGDEVITDPVTVVRKNYSWVDAAVKLYKYNDGTVTTKLILNNLGNVVGLGYVVGLAFYDGNNKMLSTKIVSTDCAIDQGSVTDEYEYDLPLQTNTVKAFIWSDCSVMMPLCDIDVLQVN